MDTSDRGLSHTFIGPGEVVNVLAGIKTRCWRASIFSIATEFIRALSIPTDNNLEELSQANVWVRGVGIVLKKLFVKTYYFHSFVWRTHSWYLSNYFRYTLYILLSMPDTTWHTQTKHQAKLYFPLSQYLRPWIATCRHQTYKLLISRHILEFFYWKFLSC